MSRILTYEGFGIHTFLDGLLRGFTQIPHEHNIILFTGPDQLVPDWIRVGNFHVVRLSPNPKNLVGRLYWDHLVVGKACRDLEVDALYAPVHIRPLYSPCPAVVTVHDMMYHLFPQDWSLSDRLYFGAAVPLLTRRAAIITTDSKNTRSDVVRLLHIAEKKVKVLYPGTPHGFIPLEKQAVLPIREKYNLTQPFILSVGSQHPRKNLACLVQAFDQIASDIPHDLVFLGPKFSNDPKLQQAIHASPFTGRMHWLGLVPREEMPLFFNAAEVFVFPSRYEGFGLPVLEALACGCPTVTTNVSSIPEVAGDASLMVSPEDVTGFSEAICVILSDGELRDRMRQNSVLQARKFSWAHSAQEMLGFLEKAAGVGQEY